MAALNELPFETLVQILSSLSTTDLAHTSLICRRLSLVSQQLLYRSPTLSIFQNTKPVQSLGTFIETLVYSGRRELASQVRSVNVSWDRSSRLDHAAYPATVWPVEFHHTPGFHGVHCVLLLHLLPSLRVLHITPPCDLPDVGRSYLSHCLEEPPDDPSKPTLHLQSLRKFTCPSADFPGGIPRPTGYGGITFGAVLALMRLPCLESIETYITHFPAVPPPGTSSVAHFSRITDLRLSMSTVYPSILAVLLRAPVALRRFSCVTVNFGVFAMSDFTTAISPLRASLEYLHLDFIRTHVSFSTQKTEIIRGSFRLWPALHTIRSSMREMVGYPRVANLALAEVLPRSLGRLEISMDQYWSYGETVAMVLPLVSGKMESLPLLRFVALDTRAFDDGAANEVLREACVQAGVELVPNGSGGW